MSYLDQAKKDEDLSAYSDFEITKALHALYQDETGAESPFEEFSAEVGLKPEITPIITPTEGVTSLDQPIIEEPAEPIQPIVEQPDINPLSDHPVEPLQEIQADEPLNSGLGVGLPTQPEEEQPVDNGIGRGQSASASFAQGAGHVVSATIKSAAMASQANRAREEKGFTPLDSILSMASPSVLRFMMEPKQREAFDRITQSSDNEDPRHNSVYEAGNAIDDWLSEHIKTNPRFEQEFWSGKVSNGLGSMAAFVVANLIGRGTLRTTGMSSPVSGAVSTATVGAASQASDGFEGAIDGGADLETAFQVAKMHALVGTSEAVPIVSILNRLDKKSGGTIGQIIKDLLKEGSEEAIQEAFQAISTNMIDKKMYDPDRKIWTGAGDGAAVGFTTGALISFLTSLVGLKSRGSTKPPKQEPEQKPEEDPNLVQPETIEVPEPTPDEIQDGRQSETVADLQEFMDDERSAEEIISERQAKEQADEEAARAQEQAEKESEAAAIAQENVEAEQAQAAHAADIAEQVALSEATTQGSEDTGGLSGDIDSDGRLPDGSILDGGGLYNNGLVEEQGTGEQDSPVKVETAEDVERASEQVDTNPSDAQIEKGNYKKAHVKMYGLDISIENPKGSTRSGKGADGKPWSVVMPASYGDIKRTTGADGENVDVYIGDNPESKSIFIVDQIDPATGKFDEHKVVLGTNTQAEAESLYDGGFSDGSGKSRMGAVTPMSVVQFKNWLKNGNTKKAFRYEHKPIPKKPEAVAKKPRKGPSREIDPKKDDILSAIAKLGGLNRDESSAQGVDPTEFGRRGHRIFRVFTKDGRSFDEIAQALQEQGYPVADEQGNYNPNTLLEKISDALAGNKVLTNQGLENQIEDQYEEEFAEELDAMANLAENENDNVRDMTAEIHEATSKLGEAGVESIIERVALQSENQSAEEYDSALIKAFQHAIAGEQQTQDDPNASQVDPDRAPSQEPSRPEQSQGFDLDQQEVTQPAAQPPSSDQDDMFGGKSETAQAIKDREVARKAKEQNAPDVGMGEGDLFSGKSKQTDIEDTKAKKKVAKGKIKDDSVKYEVSDPKRVNSYRRQRSTENGDIQPRTGVQSSEFLVKEESDTEAAEEKAKVVFGNRVKEIEVGTFNIGLDFVVNDEQAAHVFAPLRKSNVEQFLVLTLDKDNRPISILKQGYGTVDQSSVYVKDVLGAIHSTPNARYVWVGHNHPSGRVIASEADHRITDAIFDLLDGTGVDLMGSIIVGPGGKSSTIVIEGNRSLDIKTLPKRRNKTVPLTEGRLRKIGKPLGDKITNQYEGIHQLKLISKGKPGILFLDNQNQPIAYYSVNEEDLQTLRKGKVGIGASKLYQIIRQSNSAAMIGYFPNKQRGAAGLENLTTFATRAHIPLHDIIDSNGSQASRGGPFYHPGSFYSLGKTNKTFNDKKPEIAVGVKDIIKKMAPGVNIEVVDQLFAEGEALKRSGAQTTERQEVAGTFDPAENLIKVSLGLGDPQNTAQHESLHALKDMGLLSGREWQLLSNRSKKEWMKEYNVPDVEEGVASAFGDWRSNDKKFTTPITRLFQRIKTFFERLGNLLRGMGFKTADDVFESISSGEVGNRTKKSYSSKGIKTSIGKSNKPTFDGFSVPSETLLNYFARKIQDKMRRLKIVQKSVESKGKPLEESENPYLAEELYYGKSENELRKFNDDYVEPLVDAIKKRKLNTEEVDEFLYAKHAPERNKYIESINPEFKEQEIAGSGMTNEESEQIIEKFKRDGKLEALTEVSDLVYAINNARIELLRNAGLESEEVLDVWENKFENYVPLRGIGEESTTRPRTGKGFDVRGKESKRALGRQSKAESPLVYSIAQMEESIIRAQKNLVGQAFMNLVRNHPNKELWEITNAQQNLKARFNEKTGEVVVGPDPTFKLADDVLSVKVGGKEYYIKIHDEALASAMKNLGAETSSKVIRGLAAFNRYLAMMSTSLNPEFILSNFARDIQTAMINLVGEQDSKGLLKDNKKMARKVLKDVPKALKGAYQALRDPKSKGEWARWFNEYRSAGGKIGFFGLETLDVKQKKLLNLINEANNNPKAKMARAVRKTGDFIMDVNGAVENGVRLAAYVNARKAGLTKTKAASMARNLTVNFNRKGELGPLTNSLYLFFNAGLQGSVRLIYAARSKKVQAILGGIAVGSFWLAEMNRLIGGDDDDGENKYDKIASHVKQRNIILMKPDGGYYKFPLPYGYNVPHVLGESINAVYHGRDKVKTSVHLVDTIMESFNPLGTEDSDSVEKRLLKMVSPTVTDPWLQLGLNEDYAGRPIMPAKQFYDKHKPDSQRYWGSASTASKAMTAKINRLTGGNEARKGAVDVSPETVDHIFGFMSGGLGRFVLNSIDTGTRIATKEEVPVYKIPFVRRFYAEPSEYYTGRRYYECKTEIEAVLFEEKYLLNAEDDNGLKALEKEYEPLLDMKSMLRSTDKVLKRMRKIRNQVKADSTMSEEEKLSEIKELNGEIDAMQKEFIKEFNGAIRKKKDG